MVDDDLLEQIIYLVCLLYLTRMILSNKKTHCLSKLCVICSSEKVTRKKKQSSFILLLAFAASTYGASVAATKRVKKSAPEQVHIAQGDMEGKPRELRLVSFFAFLIQTYTVSPLSSFRSCGQVLP